MDTVPKAQQATSPGLNVKFELCQIQSSRPRGWNKRTKSENQLQLGSCLKSSSAVFASGKVSVESQTASTNAAPTTSECLRQPKLRHQSYSVDGVTNEGATWCARPPSLATLEEMGTHKMNGASSSGEQCSGQERSKVVEQHQPRHSYGSVNFSSQSRMVSDDLTDGSVKRCRRSASFLGEMTLTKKCTPVCWRLSTWTGAIIVLIGLFLLTAGFVFPRRQLILTRLEIKEVVALNLEADEFNDRLELFKLTGLTMICVGGIFLVVSMFLPKLMTPEDEEDYFSYASVKRKFTGSWTKLDSTVQIERVTEH